MISPIDDHTAPADGASMLPAPGENWALFLDVDGTLVELAAEPDAVRVDTRLVSLLSALQTRLDGAVALVSGRTIETLDRLFAPLRLSAAGNHGLERRNQGMPVHRPAVAPEMADIRAAMERFAHDNPGVIMEDKSLSMALHYRNRPEAAAGAADLVRTLVARYDGSLIVQNGKMMVEVRPGRGDKGTAIADFMNEPPFAGRVPVFVGDDITDEKGFEFVNARGGYSIRVGNDLKTAARYRVPDVIGVIEWLEEVVAAGN